MNTRSLVMIAAATMLLHGTSANAQVCDDDMQSTASSTRLVIQGDGTALDTQTGLRWMRCPLGYQLDLGATASASDDRCVEESVTTFDWSGAHLAAQTLNDGGGFAGATDWRVPNVKALLSTVERRCAYPAIDLWVFPEAAELFWTSTPYPQIDRAFVVDFDRGTPSFSFKSVPSSDQFLNAVRLVR